MKPNPAPTKYPINDLIRNRWSPRAFSEKPVEREKLLACLEAARWAPSSFNEQPWRFVVVTSDDPERLKAAQSVLVEGNAWARRAPVLICTVAKMTFTRNDNPNRHAYHDVGAAAENLFLEAFNQGLVAHEMAGFNTGKARVVFHIPEGYEPVAMMAVGYQDDPGVLPADRMDAETAPRKRRPLSEIVFEGDWEKPIRA